MALYERTSSIIETEQYKRSTHSRLSSAIPTFGRVSCRLQARLTPPIPSPRHSPLLDAPSHRVALATVQRLASFHPSQNHPCSPDGPIQPIVVVCGYVLGRKARNLLPLHPPRRYFLSPADVASENISKRQSTKAFRTALRKLQVIWISIECHVGILWFQASQVCGMCKTLWYKQQEAESFIDDYFSSEVRVGWQVKSLSKFQNTTVNNTVRVPKK